MRTGPLHGWDLYSTSDLHSALRTAVLLGETVLSTTARFNYHAPAVGEKPILEARPSQTNLSSCSLSDGSATGQEIRKDLHLGEGWWVVGTQPWKGLGASKGSGEGKRVRNSLALGLCALSSSSKA